MRASEAEPPPASIAFARQLARRGVRVEILIRAYRVAHIAVWRWFVAQARTLFPDPAEMAMMIEEFTAASLQFTDAITARLTTEHAEERERWVRSAAAVRMATINELVSGQHT